MRFKRHSKFRDADGSIDGGVGGGVDDDITKYPVKPQRHRAAGHWTDIRVIDVT